MKTCLCLVLALLCLAAQPRAKPQIDLTLSLSDPKTDLQIENDRGRMEKFDPIKDADTIAEILKGGAHYVDSLILKAGRVEQLTFRRKRDKPTKP